MNLKSSYPFPNSFASQLEIFVMNWFVYLHILNCSLNRYKFYKAKGVPPHAMKTLGGEEV
jgi:hypothetical protein